MRSSVRSARGLVFVLPLIAACGGSDDGGTSTTEDTGSVATDTSVGTDTNPATDTNVDPDTGTATDTGTTSDSGAADTAKADSAPSDSGADTFVPDTTLPDTTVADTTVADTTATDTTVADTAVADTAVAADTIALDTSTPDTALSDTGSTETSTTTCTDGIKNGTETDIDCGGTCSPCSVSKACLIPSDCKSLFCSAADKTCTGTCTDGEKGPGESDVDCGELCTACADGKKCSTSRDCLFGSTCVSGVCGGRATSCNELHTQQPAAPTGVYTIDPDGAGSIAPLSVTCDMTNGGGGWTLFWRHSGSVSLMSSGSVTTSSHTYMPLATVKALAAGATQVNIRTSGQYATRSITSVASAQPILNLRNGYLLNADTNMINSAASPAPYWTGPMAATAQYLWFDCGVSPYATSKGSYPNIYWACDNSGGLHAFTDQSHWVYTAAFEPIEVYLR
jgi:hypothetical protein